MGVPRGQRAGPASTFLGSALRGPAAGASGAQLPAPESRGSCPSLRCEPPRQDGTPTPSGIWTWPSGPEAACSPAEEGREGVNGALPGWGGRTRREEKTQPWGTPGGVGGVRLGPDVARLPSVVLCPFRSVCCLSALMSGSLCCADQTRRGLRSVAGLLRADVPPPTLDPAVWTPAGHPTGQEGSRPRTTFQGPGSGRSRRHPVSRQGQASAPARLLCASRHLAPAPTRGRGRLEEAPGSP